VSIFAIGSASFAQKRIWFEEHINSDPQIAVNNMPFFYRLIKGTISIERLRHILQRIVLKHCSLRTALAFDSTTDCLIQRIVQPTDNNEELFLFVKSVLNSDNDIRDIILNEMHNPLNFNLSNGHVFRVHVVVQQSDNKDILQTGDMVIFNFHQSAFDLPSLEVFHRDLYMAYECEVMSLLDNKVIRYLDCK
jgi:hypothetical protein